MNRQFSAVAIAASLLTAGSAAAQTFPSKPVRIMTGGTSGVSDVILRATAAKAQERTGSYFSSNGSPVPTTSSSTTMWRNSRRTEI